MFGTLDIFRMSADLARHAGQRQAIVAQNVANADTPGYVPRDLPDFVQMVQPGRDASVPRATRATHLHGTAEAGVLPMPVAQRGNSSPNGNEVSLEREMLRSVDAKRDHDHALAIYRSALTVLRSSLRTN